MLTQGIENEAYHGSSELSRSTAWSLLTTCPAKVKHDRENPSPATPALIIGDAFHTATLEPARFESEFAVKPKQLGGKGPSSAVYKEAFADMQAEEPHVKWLTESDYQMVCDMASSALDHPILKQYLAETDAVIEGTGYFECEGAKCKVRPDLYLPGAGVVIDLKSTMDASARGFAKSVRQFGYAFQVAWYLEGLRLAGEKPTEFIFLAVEKKAPYLTAAYSINTSEIESQTNAMYKACRIWAECTENNYFPGYADNVVPLNMERKSSIKADKLCIKDMAKHFDVSRTYVYRMLRDYKLNFTYLGNRKLYEIADFAKAVKMDNAKKSQKEAA